jgi:hypothetical protein
VVALADSERLDALFAHLLVELRLAFACCATPSLHAPYVEMNAAILERFEAGDTARRRTGCAST